MMRGGTSRGLYFHRSDLPVRESTRNQVLLACMGSPHTRQVDGLGGAHPLTSKAAIISPSADPSVDVDYLFLQVMVDRAEVSDSQNCGNILAGVGPFAIEQNLVRANDGETSVRIRMVNTGGLAVARVQTPGGVVSYDGLARIDGVLGTAAPVMLDFLDLSGASCGALLPTGNATDLVAGMSVTCIDNGMPVVLIRANELGKTGYESPAELEADTELKQRIEVVRLQTGQLMNLGDVASKTVPKMCLIARPRNGGTLSTRTFIPHRVHETIGVLGAVSVATACMLNGSVAYELAATVSGATRRSLDVEHPGGFFTVEIETAQNAAQLEVKRSSLLRTARKIMQGQVFVPASVWAGL